MVNEGRHRGRRAYLVALPKEPCKLVQGERINVTNPFEDDTRPHLVLINDEGQYSLWPSWIDVPAGWDVVFGEAERAACVEFIESHWRDMRPLSLAREMASDVTDEARS
jgi:uncharacterized protein YbdZ (MbtH family)